MPSEYLGVLHLVDSSISCYVSNLHCSCWEIKTRNVILLMNMSSNAPSSQQTCCTWKKIAVQLAGPQIHHSKNESEIVSRSTPKPVPFGLPYLHFSANGYPQTNPSFPANEMSPFHPFLPKALMNRVRPFLDCFLRNLVTTRMEIQSHPKNLEIGEHRVVNKKPNVKLVKTVLFFPWKSLMLELFYVTNERKNLQRKYWGHQTWLEKYQAHRSLWYHMMILVPLRDVL